MWQRFFSVKDSEVVVLLCSCLFIFMLFVSYSILRPLRDMLGLHGGQEELKWLFLGTFLASVVGSIAAMWLSGTIKRKLYLDCIYIFFALNLFMFYIAMSFISPYSNAYVYLARVFYIWVSVFNLFAISSAWSLLADVFSKDDSKRLFGIISAGASIGSIFGSSIVGFLAKFIEPQFFIFASMALLGVCIILKKCIMTASYQILDVRSKENFLIRFEKPLPSKNPLLGFRLIIQSRYLLALVGFILLLTSVSTFLYMEQARVIEILYPKTMEGYSQARLSAFGKIDFYVQFISFIIQICLTAKIAKIFGLRFLLSVLGFIIGIGFVILIFTHPMFLPMVIVMSIRRIGEYALIKPGREMLFVPLDSESKYKVKVFLDAVVYRCGDALSSQIEGALLKGGIGMVLLGGAIISFIWGVLGFYLGKNYEKINLS